MPDGPIRARLGDMELYAFFVHLGFSVLLCGLFIAMFCSLAWCSAALEKGAYPQAVFAIVLLFICVMLATLLAEAEPKREPASSRAPAASEGVLFSTRSPDLPTKALAKVGGVKGGFQERKNRPAREAGRFSAVRG